MSVKIMGQVWGFSRAKGSALLLLLAIADSAEDEYRQCYAKQGTLARKIRCSESWLRYLVTKLEELGEITVIERAKPDGRNCYTVTNFDGSDARYAHFPELDGNIKDTERQQAIMADRRKRAKKRRRT